MIVKIIEVLEEKPSNNNIEINKYYVHGKLLVQWNS